jgi:hypothetical protein
MMIWYRSGTDPEIGRRLAKVTALWLSKDGQRLSDAAAFFLSGFTGQAFS